MNRRQQLTKTLLDFYQKPVAKVSFELFLSISAILFFLIFAIQPTLLTMSDLIKELEDKQVIDQQLSQKIAALSTAQTTYLQLQDQLPLLTEALPTRPYLKESLLVMEKIASDRNLVIENMLVKELPLEQEADIAKANVERQSMSVVITLTGSYPNISGYIEELLSVRRTFVIDSIIFSRNESRGRETLRANISLSIPFFAEKSTEATTQTTGSRTNQQPSNDVEI